MSKTNTETVEQPQVAVSSTDLLGEPPKGKGYKRTNEIAKFLGRFDTDIVIAQKWRSDYVGEADVWVAIPTYLLS
jgi:hypothetical protein